MLIRNATKLCTERGYQGRLEPAGYGAYGFVITTSAGQYRLPVIPGMGPVADTGRVNEYVVETILLYDTPAATPPAREAEPRGGRT
jgi:hypothetical protein